MENIKDIAIDQYNYVLPNDRIAKYPLQKRDQSKLLIVANGHISDDTFQHIGNHLPHGAKLIANETKVVQARILFRKTSGAIIEIFCLEPLSQMMDYQLAFASESPVSWRCLVGNSKRWKSGPVEKKLLIENKTIQLRATRTTKNIDHSVIEFSWDNQGISFAQILEACGEVPLPPYLNRAAEEDDKNTYQTIYAQHHGSVAAPTAGLHFTEELLNNLDNQGFIFSNLTLHVGAGTFKPVVSDTIGEHEMHAETMTISRAFLYQLKAELEKPIIAVGTTTMRTLESLYWFGLMINEQSDMRPSLDQWTPYISTKQHISVEKSIQNILDYLDHKQLDQFTAQTSLMIAPGYHFKIVKGLITNFHQPKSTLLLLVAALIGEQWKKAYEYALNHEFRFLSYGDSCLFIP